VKLLLDTHALLWWLTDDGQLSGQARELVEDPGNDVLISMVSLWEITVKTRVGKLEADIRQIMDAVQQEGFTLLDIGIAHLVTLAGLPMHHRGCHVHFRGPQHSSVSRANADMLRHDVTFVTGRVITVTE
jgi:PIN domain nuclease of toxin-antitoxin system